MKKINSAAAQASLRQKSSHNKRLVGFAVRSISPVLKLLLLPLLVLALSGCESINMNRLAYDFLRQEDCRRNDVDVYEFCSRTFVFEYDEYEQLRQEYIRTEAERSALEEKNRQALANAAWY